MVTDRDLSVEAWVAVIGAVSAQDVMSRVGVGRTVGYRRLRALVDHGHRETLSDPRARRGFPKLQPRQRRPTARLDTAAAEGGIGFAGIWGGAHD